MADLSTHRPPDADFYSWVDMYIEKMGAEHFKAYMDWVFEILDRLQEGKYYEIMAIVPEEKIDLFVKVGCFYVNTHRGYWFSEDYSKIIHYGETC